MVESAPSGNATVSDSRMAWPRVAAWPLGDSPDSSPWIGQGPECSGRLVEHKAASRQIRSCLDR